MKNIGKIFIILTNCFSLVGDKKWNLGSINILAKAEKGFPFVLRLDLFGLDIRSAKEGIYVNMKSLKFIVVIMVTIFLSNIGCSVSAEKKDWIDKTYNFSAVKNVFICKIDDSVIPALDDKLDEQIQLIGRKFENKIKRPILAEDSENLADIKVISQIIEWEKESKYIPEEIYYEGWETKTTRDRDGKEKRERHYKKSRVWFFGAHERRIPAHYVYDSVLKVSFEVYDIKSGNLVMKRDDKRRRVGSSEHLNMFERICKSFFQDLNKEIKLSRR